MRNISFVLYGSPVSSSLAVTLKSLEKWAAISGNCQVLMPQTWLAESTDQYSQNMELTAYYNDSAADFFDCLSKTKYNKLVFLQPDEILEDPESYTLFFDEACRQNADVFYSQVSYQNKEGKVWQSAFPKSLSINYLYRQSPALPGCIFDRSVFAKVSASPIHNSPAAQFKFFFDLLVLKNGTSSFFKATSIQNAIDPLTHKWGNRIAFIKDRKAFLAQNVSPVLVSFIEKSLDNEAQLKRSLVKRSLKISKKLGNWFIAARYNIGKISWKNTRMAFKMAKPAKPDFKQIPIIINNCNHFTYLKKMIDDLEKRGYFNIFIIDNNSTYPPLLDYYKTLNYKIYFLGYNEGYCALWDTPVFNDFKDQYYVYSDPDILPLAECPDDFMALFYYALQKNPDLQKVGFGLCINDLPDHYQHKQSVINWEKKFFKQPMGNIGYRAVVDSTFALYRPNARGGALVTKAMRTAMPYMARHLPWYENSALVSEELEYYVSHAKTATHWSEMAKK